MLPMYSETSACPKCGCTTASARWCPGTADPRHLPGCTVDPAEGEHIHRKCANCGYERIEAPLDAGG